MKAATFTPHPKPVREPKLKGDFKPREPKPAPGARMRKCGVKECRAPFAPRSMTHKACSPECAATLAVAVRQVQAAKAARADRAATRAKLTAMKPRKWWLAKAKVALHAFIRTRDEGKPCISCDTPLLKLGRPGGDFDAGHFRSVGSAKHLEFEECNIFGQCKHCNDHLKGNQLEYERRLRARVGDAHVDALKADNAPRKLGISDFQAIEARYKAKLKHLKETAPC